MTEQQEFQYAAKAAGYSVCSFQHGKANCYSVGNGSFHWNPRTSNAYAFALMVKLSLSVTFHENTRVVEVAGHLESLDSLLYHDSPEAATREAIFQAAVAIGKALP